jgi:hypothetical protein
MNSILPPEVCASIEKYIPKKKIYLVERIDDYPWYDNYSDIIVCAGSEEDARNMTPFNKPYRDMGSSDSLYWVTNINKLKVTLLGQADTAIKEGLVIAHFKPG